MVVGTPSFITLKLDPRITPQELAIEYSKIRRRIMGNRHAKPLSKKHKELEVFAAERKEGHTWNTLMCDWNKTFPKEAFPNWQYDNNRRFTRDAKAAIKKPFKRQSRLCQPFYPLLTSTSFCNLFQK